MIQRLPICYKLTWHWTACQAHSRNSPHNICHYFSQPWSQHLGKQFIIYTQWRNCSPIFQLVQISLFKKQGVGVPAAAQRYTPCSQSVSEDIYEQYWLQRNINQTSNTQSLTALTTQNCSLQHSGLNTQKGFVGSPSRKGVALSELPVPSHVKKAFIKYLVHICVFRQGRTT